MIVSCSLRSSSFPFLCPLSRFDAGWNGDANLRFGLAVVIPGYSRILWSSKNVVEVIENDSAKVLMAETV